MTHLCPGGGERGQHLAVGEAAILLTHPLHPFETPAKWRGGRSRMAVSRTASTHRVEIVDEDLNGGDRGGVETVESQGKTVESQGKAREGSGSARQRRCLSTKAVGAQGKGGVRAVTAVEETQCKKSV